MSPTRAAVAALVLPLALPAAGCGGQDLPAPLGLGGDFTLTATDGSAWRLADHAGRPTVLFFGFTFCPDVCPTTLSELGQVRDELGADFDDVQVVFVSVDPERDTPARLQEYLDAFSVRAVGLTGTQEELAAVLAAYGAFADKVEVDGSAGYLIDHTARSYLLDRDCVLRFAVRYEDPPAVTAAALRALLAAG